MRATHIPRRPKKKPLRGKKVGFAEKKHAYSLPDCRVWRQLQLGHAMGGAAGEKGCAPTFNALSDSEVRMDYMAEVCAYLPYDAVVFLW